MVQVDSWFGCCNQYASTIIPKIQCFLRLRNLTNSIYISHHGTVKFRGKKSFKSNQGQFQRITWNPKQQAFNGWKWCSTRFLMYLFKSGCSGYQTRIKLSCSRPKFNFAQTGETWQGLTAPPYKKLSTADGRRCHMLISLMVDGRISISHLVRRSLSPNNNPSVKRISPSFERRERLTKKIALYLWLSP